MTESHTQEARHHLVAARAKLYLQAQVQGRPVPPALERAARHTNEALSELDTFGVDVRPGVPDDFPRQ